jgi:predicted metal-dependent hydrolase
VSTIVQPALPPYSLRVSSRARHVRLTVTAREGLVVVVPRGTRINADEIVAAKRAWALRALASVADQRALHAAGPDALLPHEVVLPALSEHWQVDYHEGGSTSVRATTRGSLLVVSGAIDDGDACLRALNGWIHRIARVHLPQRLAQLAREHDLVYSAVRVGRQRSRWGSCSSRGTISLTLLRAAPRRCAAAP